MLVSRGNSKLHTDTLIFNITSATNCPSKRLGLCQIPDNCYALRPEKRWKETLPYRERQTKDWDSKSAFELASELAYEISRHFKPKIKYVRFSEAGDFRDQQDIEKLKQIAKLLPSVIFYGYTARSDLNYNDRPNNLIINGSGFMLDNSFTVIPKQDKDKHPIVCSSDCENCMLCKEKEYKDIKIPIH
jgi:hypothetical protein